jgi:putative transposase
MSTSKKPVVPMKGFKGQAYPNANQRSILTGWFGSSRWVYNALLHLMQYSYYCKKGDFEAIAKLKSRPDLEWLYPLMVQDEIPSETVTGIPIKVSANERFFGYLITCFKNDPAKHWLSEVPRDVLTYSARGLVKAFKGFYRKVKLRKHIGPKGLIGFPRYKSKHSRQSITMQPESGKVVCTNSQTKRHDIRLTCPDALGAKGIIPGWLKVKGLKKLQGRLLSITISLDSTGDYNASIATEHTVVRSSGAGVIGIDMTAQHNEVGYAQDDFKPFKLSDIFGISMPIKAIQAIENRIIHLQRLLARKTKGSRAKAKMRINLAKAHKRLSGIYEAYYHLLTNWLIKTYDIIVIEDLDVEGMLGKNGNQLNKLVQDSRFSRFKSMLLYKIEQVWAGYGYLLLADKWYPSTQLCSACGQRPVDKIALKVKAWTCDNCGAVHHRDYNAAMNLYNLHKEPVKRPLDAHLILVGAYQA